MRRRVSARTRRVLCTITATFVLLFTFVSPAAATPPVTLDGGYVTDTAGVLSATEQADIDTRLDELARTSSATLFVVFVDTFTDPDDRQEWADAVANQNGIGPSQYLLAVAVEGRQFYISADSSGPISEARLTQIERDIQPLLSSSSWAEAALAAADGFTDSPPANRGSAGLVVGVIIVGVVALVAGLVVQGRRRSKKATTANPDAPAGPYDDISDEELERRAGSALVQIDDALASSREDLGFAVAQFGDNTTATFTEVIARAQASVAEAFSLRQKLDDEIPDTNAQRRAWHIQIIELCEQADALLDENVEAFDELRKLEEGAEDALRRLVTRRDELEQAVTSAPAVLARLQQTYTNDALSTVIDNPTQARSRLQLADSNSADASALLAAGRRGEAAFAIRTAEEGVVQAEQLNQALLSIGTDLATAEQHAHALIADLEGDLVAASQLTDASGQLAPISAETRMKVDRARAQLAATPRNPLTVLAALTDTNNHIDGVVAQVRDAQQQAARLQQQIDQILVQAQAQISSAGDFITTRRGAIGPTARTRYSQAGSAYQQAVSLRASDPAAAYQHAQLSLSLAQQAVASAQADMSNYGGWGGGSQTSLGGDILGGIVGGIIAGGMRGGSSRPASSPWGGSSSWRSTTPRRPSGGRSFGPSSFGGSRGRPGGGRF